MEPIISIKNLSVVYDKGTQAEIVALSDISLDIFPGEFVIVLDRPDAENQRFFTR